MIKPRYVKVDLTSKSVEPYEISETDAKLYIGGKTLGAKILYDNLEKGVDPLGPHNIFVVNTGPLNGTGAPASSRFNISTKNVLTGGIASSNCGGTFGFRLRKAGFDGVIVSGKSEKPCYIEIMDGKVTIKDASKIWGMNTEEVQEHFDSRYGKLVIGPAGENLVRYSCAVSGERVAGRCGVGAVMGSKNLKGLIAYGTIEIPIYNREKLSKYTKKWTKYLKSHPVTGEALALYGTAGFLSKCDATGILPTKNFQKGKYSKAEEISGETLYEKHLTKNGGCVSCPIRCERRVLVGGKDVKGPEYETLGLFGSNIENANLSLINEWNLLADLYGMDTISLAGTLAFAMELKEKGLEDFDLSFGETGNISEVMRKIAFKEEPYAELGMGAKYLSEKYGGVDFAIHSKGMELAAYEPRNSVGMGLGYATSNRGACHLNGGYGALLENLSVLTVDPLTIKSKPEIVIFFQNLLEAVSSAGFCLQTTQALIPNVVYSLNPSSKLVGLLGKSLISSGPVLSRIWNVLPGLMPFNSMLLAPQAECLKHTLGIRMTCGKFLQFGERSFNIERMFNVREGFSSKDDSLPKRLTKVAIDDSKDSLVKLDEMLPQYYKVRGWDHDGKPMKRKLKRLGL